MSEEEFKKYVFRLRDEIYEFFKRNREVRDRVEVIMEIYDRLINDNCKRSVYELMVDDILMRMDDRLQAVLDEMGPSNYVFSMALNRALLKLKEERESDGDPLGR